MSKAPNRARSEAVFYPLAIVLVMYDDDWCMEDCLTVKKTFTPMNVCLFLSMHHLNFV